jgi:hypothetical protein
MGRTGASLPSLRLLANVRNGLPSVVSALLAVGTLLASPAAATSKATVLLYDYEFTGTTGVVNNSAPFGLTVPLTLFGTWTAVPDGVHFSGDTSGNASVAYGRPASGDTIREPSSAAVGFGARIVYNAPATGTCFSDTPNVTQIGRYSAGSPSAQLKLQLSSCADNSTQVTMECRVAGALTVANAPPLISTLPLINGDTYNVTCVKSPDWPSNTATITLTVTNLNAPQGSQTVTDTFTVLALGYLRTKEYISAGNKYPLPAPAQNTDQFNGDITRVVYCAGAPANVGACLAASLPGA